MDYYRIIKREHANSPLGYGRNAGRWNSRNVPMIYASSATALSMTEYLCIKGSAVLTSAWALVTYSINGDIPALEKESLPIEWDARPYPLTTQIFGDSWVKRQPSVCLKVPSARLLLSSFPREHNLLINPFHGDFASAITVRDVEDLNFHLNAWATSQPVGPARK